MSEKPFAYSVERTFKTDLETMWSAWMNAESLEAWYHPTMLKSVEGVFESEPVVDGVWAVAVDVSMHGFNAYFYGKYTALVENVRIEHTMHYTQDAAVFEARDFGTEFHNVIIEFEPRDGGVWAKFSQFGVLPEGEAPRAQEGMESYFDSLDAFLGNR
jgi:uncharacterized protein YndB with AHSA1/START domain